MCAFLYAVTATIVLIYFDRWSSALSLNGEMNCYLAESVKVTENTKVSSFDGVSANSTTSALLKRDVLNRSGRSAFRGTPRRLGILLLPEAHIPLLHCGNS